MSKIHKFVFFSAGPVGDHLVEIDTANYFFKTTGAPSVILDKHPSAFLSDLSLFYRDHIEEIPFRGFSGLIKVLLLVLQSVFFLNVYVFIFPIPLPLYLKLFIYFIRFCTRSRAVGFHLEGTKSFPVGGGYSHVFGEVNTIPMRAEPFAQSAERMLSFLGFKTEAHVPRLQFTPNINVLKKLGVERGKYIVLHITPSHILRTLPSDRWNKIIRTLLKKLPEVKLVFTGAGIDSNFIEQALAHIPRDRIVSAVNKTSALELLTLYDNARVNVVVQTGNGLMVNMLNKPTVVVDIKGTAMFYYDFNDLATIIYSNKDCTCNPFETECTMIPYKGEEYMACIFNINDSDVVDAVVQKYLKAKL